MSIPRYKKPHIWLLPGTLGSWVVNVGQSRVVGWNNTFRTFDEACSYALRLAIWKSVYDGRTHHHKEAQRGH